MILGGRLSTMIGLVGAKKIDKWFVIPYDPESSPEQILVDFFYFKDDVSFFLI